MNESTTTVTIDRWHTPPRLGPGLRDEGYTLVADNGHRIYTAGTEFEVRAFVKRHGWTVEHVTVSTPRAAGLWGR